VTYLRVVATVLLIYGLACVSSVPSLRRADLLISDARLLTRPGEILQRSAVVVIDGTIQEVVAGELDREATTVIEGENYTVLPGLIDTHVHLLTQSPIVDGDAAMAQYLNEILPGVLDEYLAAGFTSVMSTGDFWPFIAEVKARIDRGAIRGPRIFVLGPMFTTPGAHPATTMCAENPWCRAHLAVEVDDEGDAREMVDAIAQAGADGIKIVFDASRDNSRFNIALGRAVTDRASAHNLPVRAHAHTNGDINDALGLGVSGFVHTPHEPISDELLERMMATDSSFATTLSNSQLVAGQPSEFPREPQKQNLTTLVEAGFLVAFGTNNAGGESVGSALLTETQALQDAGMTSSQILTALTAGAAEYLGRLNELGTIEVGKRADFLIVEGDPTTDLTALTNVVAVVKDGALIVDYR
jgi:imidazolonepropionase-like amidohydrolase